MHRQLSQAGSGILRPILSDVAGGELRKPVPPPAPPPGKRPSAPTWPGNVRISGPVAARAAWERLTGGDP